MIGTSVRSRRQLRQANCWLSGLVAKAADLLTIAIPHIEDIHQFIEGSDCAILLADGTARILTMGGDQSALEAINELGIGQGTYWAEGQLGTNALALVLITAMLGLTSGRCASALIVWLRGTPSGWQLLSIHESLTTSSRFTFFWRCSRNMKKRLCTVF